MARLSRRSSRFHIALWLRLRAFGRFCRPAKCLPYIADPAVQSISGLAVSIDAIDFLANLPSQRVEGAPSRDAAAAGFDNVPPGVSLRHQITYANAGSMR